MPFPILNYYDKDHLSRIALPLGGIGTGTVSLGGRGDLRDWEIMNRPAKGFIPGDRFGCMPFFALYARPAGGEAVTRLLEGPIEHFEYEGFFGSQSANHGLPRFRQCAFAAAYPFGQVMLADEEVPVDVRLEAFNPFIPCDADRSGMPMAILRYVLTSKVDTPVTASVCGALPNFIGMDGTDGICKENQNKFRAGDGYRGLYMTSRGVDRNAAQWGTMALATTAEEVSYRTAWQEAGWGSSKADFWDDFSEDGRLEEREPGNTDMPTASLAAQVDLAPMASVAVTFLLAWHFPNRYTWTPAPQEEGCCDGGACCDDSDRIGNYYTTQYDDAWDVVEQVTPQLDTLEADTVKFAEAFCSSDLPDVVKEAALFNLSTLRSQTCFRTPDGRFYGWEGCNDKAGCCLGSCTHVWNYEQSTAFLFGDLAKTMREVEFMHATGEDGMMSFRVSLPLERARNFHHAAADGQMGCIMKIYRDWQLSGDDDLLRTLWPRVKQALAFCWVPGGWDADRDGVMEGCQHNTMDVEYYGPNPQMGIWYLGALRAAEEMARYLKDDSFADTCRDLYERGRTWTDEHLFNGEYYEHEIRPPKREDDVAEALRVGMGTGDVSRPDYQLGPGCLVDQLVGQYMAHVCGLDYLVDEDHVRTTLRSILKYNHRDNLSGHFNVLRSYALGDEAALLMADYPKEKPDNPFPYFTEVMTGFEYTAAIGMLYEGMTDEGIACIQDIRNRYDGRKRNPFDEAECGHHYARAMAAWAAHLSLTGFSYSAVTRSMTLTAQPGRYFWSTGYAWGTCIVSRIGDHRQAEITVLYGELTLSQLRLDDTAAVFDSTFHLTAGEQQTVQING
jgi:non-lysosomal glucosylceramidase